MVVTSTYAERLRDVLGVSQSADKRQIAAAARRLSELLGVSYTAARKALTSPEGGLSAANSSKVARHFNVDHYWLATGDGDRNYRGDWPYAQFSRWQFDNYLTAEERAENEALLLGKIVIAERAAQKKLNGKAA